MSSLGPRHSLQAAPQLRSSSLTVVTLPHTNLVSRHSRSACMPVPHCCYVYWCDLGLHLCRPDDLEQPPQHSHGRKDMPTRRAGVIAVASTYADGNVDYHAAVRRLKDIDGGIHYKALSADHRLEFLQTHWQHFWEHGDLRDDPRTGRPVIISDEDAVAASELLKDGQKVTRNIKGDSIDLITGFATMLDALEAEPELRAIADKYDATAEQLYAAVHRVDPHLCQRSMVFKPAFTSAEKSRRMRHGSDMLERAGSTEAEQRGALDPIIWGDEFSCCVGGLKHKSVKVYADDRVAYRHDYVSVTGLRKHKAQKVRVFLAVSSHPAFYHTNGLVFWDFTTSTTNIHRHYNTMGQEEDEPYIYMVGVLAGMNATLPYAQQVGAQTCFTLSHRSGTWLSPKPEYDAVNTTARRCAAVAMAAITICGWLRSATCTLTSAQRALKATSLQSQSRLNTAVLSPPLK